MTQQDSNAAPAVYVQTNDATDNEVLAFERARRRTALRRSGASTTGGRGTGEPHLPSQSSVVLSDDGRRLLVVNAGSDELSLFAVESGRPAARRIASPRAARRRPASPSAATSSTSLNNGTPEHHRLHARRRRLVALEGSTRPLSADDADPAQVVVQPSTAARWS